MLRERSTAARACRYGGVKPLQQGSIPAAKIGDVTRLRLERQTVEIVHHGVFHFVEKATVLRRRAKDVKSPIEVSLVSVVIAFKHGSSISEQQRVHLSQHR